MSEREDPIASSGSSVALIGPRFFSYLVSVAARLTHRGCRATVLDDLHSNSVFARVLYRLRVFDVISLPRRRYLNRLIRRICDEGIQDVILVSAESPDRRFVKALLESGRRVHVYMWDSVRNKSRVLEYLDLVQGRASFDPDDCVRLGMTYIPLFAEDVFSARINTSAALSKPSADLGFSGTLHSNRAQLLRQATQMMSKENWRIFLQLYCPSPVLLLIRRVVSPHVAQLAPVVSTKGFTKQEVFRGFRDCRYVLDLPHPGQVGLTMRTFEVLRAGARLLTTCTRVRELLPGDFGDRVVVLRDMRELQSILAAEDAVLPPLSDKEDYLVSIDRFVDDLLRLIAIPK